MKNLILILFVLIALISCGTKEVEKKTSNSSIEKVISPVINLEFSDPSRMAGSSFGPFFISMLRAQNYDMALKFTSKSSIERFGIEKIKEKYRTFNYNYKLIQKSMSKDDGIITLTYATNEFATGKLKKIDVVLENDSCKIILPKNLDDLLK